MAVWTWLYQYMPVNMQQSSMPFSTCWQDTSLRWCGKEVARSGLVELGHVTGNGSSSPTSFRRETSSDATRRTCFQHAMETSPCRRRRKTLLRNQVPNKFPTTQVHFSTSVVYKSRFRITFSGSAYSLLTSISDEYINNPGCNSWNVSHATWRSRPFRCKFGMFFTFK